jgi:Holliday junction resolvasome RuvABC endonuclease subunit
MTHIAFDLGLVTTGVAWDGGSDHHKCPHKYTKSPMTPERQHDRYCWWRDTFKALLLPHRGADVVVESPFWHPKHPSGSMALAMLHGVFRAVAIDGGHMVHMVTPSELKRMATGNGNASKEAMMRTACQLGFEGDDDNECDAYLLFTVWRGETERAA